MDICIEVLICCNKKIGITHIIDSTRTSHVPAKEGIDELIKRGMVEKIPKYIPLKVGGRRLSKSPKNRVKIWYKITERGKLFLDKVEEMRRVWEGSV